MNIFYLSNDPKKCAAYHVDKHVVKMILEYSQLLSTAHRILDENCLSDDLNSKLYKLTHKNHPSAIWCRLSTDNYQWLWSLLVDLCDEYTYRYGKVHKCESSGLVEVLRTCPYNIPAGQFTEPTPAMPEEYIIKDDSISSYRNYYLRGKQHLASWKGKINGRDVPKWFSYGCLDLMAEDAQRLGLGY